VSREQKILEAAEKLFSERSFDGVGIDAIGKEAGIVGSGIYRHFKGKQEILAALIDQATDELLLNLAAPTGDPFEDLRILVTGHVEFCLTHSRLADIWQREHHVLSQEQQRRANRRQQLYIERWAGCLDACYPGRLREELLATIRATHALMSSDTTRRAGAKQAPGLAGLLVTLTLAGLEGLRVKPARAVSPT
jgi:AcrR family transcriptional regulator